MNYRVGNGYDLHRMKTGRVFMLGGVRVEWPEGPYGHSDGDPLAHAFADALLGGAGLGDIGEHFPDSELAWKNSPGDRILGLAAEKMRAAGWELVNADATVTLEQPRLKPHKDGIRRHLAEVLAIAPERISIKAKTNEGFDSLGRGECVAVWVTVLLGRE
jgi:2-C-methyl-D-erythritol 2,4-cyclodiphosphate synthase